jgi:hypothetical protein
VAASDKIQSHGFAHNAQSDETDVIDHVLPPYSV